LTIRIALSRLGIAAEQAAKFRKEHDISRGYLTLEWILPSPPPEHTFEELPIIKEAEEEHSTTFEARAARVLEGALKSKAVTAEHTQAFESLAKEFSFDEKEKATFKELLNRYAKGQTPAFPNEYEEHAHHDEHH
jgi:heme/copper-type cytochrome/quinol oxidase subunit 1